MVKLGDGKGKDVNIFEESPGTLQPSLTVILCDTKTTRDFLLDIIPLNSGKTPPVSPWLSSVSHIDKYQFNWVQNLILTFSDPLTLSYFDIL